MTTANEAWMDALIRHQVGLMRVAPGISEQVNDLLNKSETDMIRQIRARYAKGMNAKRLEGLLSTVRSARSSAWKDVNQLWADAMTDLAAAEPAFLDQTLNAVSPTQLATTLPTATRLADIAKSTPFEGGVMGEWAAKVAQGDLDRIQQQIKVGLAQGENVAQISARLVGTAQMKGANGVTQITRNNADSLTRTAVNAITNGAKQEYYAQNAELFESEVFLATLDARTTLVCASNDNKQFPLGVGPVPPLHWRCRSLRMATLNGEVIGNRPMKPFTDRQLLGEYAEKHGLGRITKRDQLPTGHKGAYDKYARQRARELVGRVPARTSYNEWLKGQNASFQDSVLGPARGKMFREGELTLDRFVNQAGDKLTLKELAARDAFDLDAAAAPSAKRETAPLGYVKDTKLKGTQYIAEQGVPAGVLKNVETRLDEVGWNQLFKDYDGAQAYVYNGTIPAAPQANGRMNGKIGRMQLSTQRTAGAGTTNWSISESQAAIAEKINATAVHEFGHAVHLFEGTAAAKKLAPQVDKIIMDRYNGVGGSREFTTKYAAANHKEYFAEAFAQYHIDPEALFQSAPKAYEMVDQVLEVRGLPRHQGTFLSKSKPAPVPEPKPPQPAVAPSPAPKPVMPTVPDGPPNLEKLPNFLDPKTSSPVPGQFNLATPAGRQLFSDSLDQWGSVKKNTKDFKWRQEFVADAKKRWLGDVVKPAAPAAKPAVAAAPSAGGKLAARYPGKTRAEVFNELKGKANKGMGSMTEQERKDFFGLRSEFNAGVQYDAELSEFGTSDRRWFEGKGLSDAKVQATIDRMTPRVDALDKDAAAALERYTGADFKRIRWVQAGLTDDEIMDRLKEDGYGFQERLQLKKQLPAIRKAAEDLPRAQAALLETVEEPLYRGINVPREAMQKFLEGDVLDHGPFSATSTTFDPTKANFFMKGDGQKIMFTYNGSKQGTPTMFQQNATRHEQEVLLGPGRYRIVERRWNVDGILEIDLEPA
jgi:hypothetical protein